MDLQKHMEDVRFANVIFFTIGQDFVEPALLMNEFKIDSRTAEDYIANMNAMHIIQGMRIAENKIVYRVMINSFSQLSTDFVDKLKTLGHYTDEQLFAQIEPPDDIKTEYSPILDSDKWNWHTSEEIPAEDKLLYIRIRNDTPTLKTKSTITYVEDSRLARYINGQYVLEPPYIKYDASPLTNRDTFNEGAIVTNWAYASEEDLQLWKDRFNFILDYKHLDVTVDEEYESAVYTAFVLASAAISSYLQSCNPKDPLFDSFVRSRDVMSDLMSVIDRKQYPEIYGNKEE